MFTLKLKCDAVASGTVTTSATIIITTNNTVTFANGNEHFFQARQLDDSASVVRVAFSVIECDKYMHVNGISEYTVSVYFSSFELYWAENKLTVTQ